MTPQVSSCDLDSSSSESSENSSNIGDLKISNLLKCFDEISLEGLKVGLTDANGQILKAEFMPTLSSLNFVKKQSNISDKNIEINLEISK